MTDITNQDILDVKNLSQNKSIYIEGDKSFFVSKAAIDRLKRDLKNNDTVKLEKNDYFKDDWTYQIVSQTDLEIKIEIVNKKDIESDNKPRVLNCDERRQILKDKLKKMRNANLSQANFKNKYKNIVPKDLLDEYLSLKKHKLPTDLLDPAEVLSNPDEYKNMVHTMVQSFGMFKGNNNPVINYYKSLANHLNLPTTFIGNQNDEGTQDTLKQLKETIKKNPALKNLEEAKRLLEEAEKNTTKTNNFVEQLQMERQILVENDVDIEMKKIYESLGINPDS